MNRDARIRCKALDLLNRGTLSRSECSLELIRWLKPLLDAKVLSQERSGAGQVLRVQRRDDLERYIRRQFPGTSIPDRKSVV